jgi:TPR repeat protein
MAKGWDAQKLENVLQDTTPFRNRFSDHFGHALGVVVERDATGDDPASTWLRTAYPLRNKVAHNGYRPNAEEAVNAVVLAFDLMDFAASRAEEDTSFGITFPEISDLLPVPGLDERSLAQGDASERRLAQEAFDAALRALENEDEGAARESFDVAYQHGSSKAAFNLGVVAWRAGEPEEAITWFRRAADQGHGGACAYLGVFLLRRDEFAEAEDLFNRASSSGHPRGRLLGTFFEATLLWDRGDLHQAAQLYRNAAVVSDFSLGPEAAFRRGAVLQELNDPAAIDAFQFGVELGSARAAVALAEHFRVLQSADDAGAMFRRALSLDADHGSEAVDIGHHIEITLYDSNEDSVRAAVARGFVMTGALLDEQERGDDAVALYDEVVTVFGSAVEPVLREAVARAIAEEFRQAMTPTIKALRGFAAAVTDLVARPAVPNSPALRELQAEPELRARSDWINPIADTHLFGAMTLRSAADHLAAFADLFDARKPPLYAHLTIARTAMEHSALAAWLSDPRIGPEERAKRGMCERLYSAKSAARELGSQEPDSTLTQYELDARNLGWEAHFDEADRPTVDNTSWPSIPESIATLLGIQDGAGARNALWRRLTAVTHGAWWGLEWALMIDAATPSAPGHAQVPLGTDSVKVAMPAVGILRVMREAATTRFALTGWAGRAEWRAASHDSVVLEQSLLMAMNRAQ